MPAASCMSGRRAPARCRARPATARAATSATVTDANLVLGYLDPDNFLGGDRRLDRGGGRARRRSRSPPRSASTGSRRRAASTASSTRTWPRGCGSSRCGAASIRGGSRCSRSAARPGCTRPTSRASSGLARVVVPRVAAVLSAWGMLATDLRFEVSRTHIGDAGALDGAAVKRLFDEMEAEGMRRLRASFAGPARASRSADMRYGEQVFEITVPLDDVRLVRRRPAAADRRAVPPPARGALHLCDAGPGKRAGQRARDRVGYSRRIAARAEPAALAARRAAEPSAASISTAGWRRRSTASTRWRRGSASPARR